MRATDSPRAKIILYFIPRIHTEKYMNYAPPTLSRVLETGAPDSPARTERDCARGRTVTEDTRTCDRSDTTAAVRPQPPRTSAAMRCARSALRITILTTSQRARRSRAPAGAPVGRRIRSPVRFECALRCGEVSAGRGARHFLSPYLVRAATGALAMVWIPPCTLAPRMFPTSSCLSQDHPPHAPRTIRAFETQ